MQIIIRSYEPKTRSDSHSVLTFFLGGLPGELLRAAVTYSWNPRKRPIFWMAYRHIHVYMFISQFIPHATSQTCLRNLELLGVTSQLIYHFMRQTEPAKWGLRQVSAIHTAVGPLPRPCPSLESSQLGPMTHKISLMSWFRSTPVSSSIYLPQTSINS